MQVPLNDLKRQANEIRDALTNALEKVICSGRYILGDEVSAFEQAFANYCGRPLCVGVGNGFDALSIALTALELGPADEVITTSNAGGYGTLSVLAAGAQPVLVDIDPTSLNMSPAALEDAISPRSKAILVTHLHGRMADMESILRASARANLYVIEDCSHSHGAIRNGRKAGAWGDIGCFSFYPTKNLGALGDAGAIVVGNEALASSIRELRNYGWRSVGEVARMNGRNSRLDEIQAAALLAKLPYLEERNERRRAICRRYQERIQHTSIWWPAIGGEDDTAHLCVLRTPDRDRLRAFLATVGVATGIHYPLVDHEQPAIRLQLSTAPRLPHSEAAARELLTLPNFPEMTEGEIDHVSSSLESWLESTL